MLGHLAPANAMGFIDSFILVGLFLIGLPLARAVGWVLEKVTGIRMLGALPIWIVLVAVVAGVPLAEHWYGEQTMARVTGRGEVVHVALRGGGWYNRRELGVRFLPRHPERADPTSRTGHGDSVSVSVTPNMDVYDRTLVGALVPVTYVSFRPSIARMSDRTLGDFWREALAVPQAVLVFGLVALIVLALACSRWSPQSHAARWMRRLAWAVIVGGGVLLYFTIALLSPTTRAGEPTPAGATARVVSVQRITRHWFSGRRYSRYLAEPFDVVEIEFVPRSFAGPVRTADAIDIGSVPGVAEGATVAIHYDPADPRFVRVDGATHGFEAANRRGSLESELGLIGLLALIVGVSFLFRKRAMPRAMPRTAFAAARAPRP